MYKASVSSSLQDFQKTSALNSHPKAFAKRSLTESSFQVFLRWSSLGGLRENVALERFPLKGSPWKVFPRRCLWRSSFLRKSLLQGLHQVFLGWPSLKGLPRKFFVNLRECLLRGRPWKVSFRSFCDGIPAMVFLKRPSLESLIWKVLLSKSSRHAMP